MLARLAETALKNATRNVRACATKLLVFVLLAIRVGREMYVQMVRVATLVELFFLSRLQLRLFQLQIFVTV